MLAPAQQGLPAFRKYKRTRRTANGRNAATALCVRALPPRRPWATLAASCSQPPRHILWHQTRRLPFLRRWREWAILVL